MPIELTNLFASAALLIPQQPQVPRLNPWIEAGITGAFIGSYIGFFLAMAYRNRLQRRINALRAHVTVAASQPRVDQPSDKTAQASVNEGFGSVALDEHVKSIAAVLGQDATAEWNASLRKEQQRLIRLHRAFE